MLRSFIKSSILSLLCITGMGGISAWADVSSISKGDIELRKGNYEEAIALYKRAQTEESGNAERAMDRLYQVYAKLRRYDEAAQLLTELINRTHSKDYRYELAEMYLRSGNYYAAQRAFEEMLGQDPSDEAAMIGAGQCLDATGNYDAAREYYRKVVEKEGQYAGEARRLLARIENSSVTTSIDVDAEVGRWAPEKMPLKVSVADGKDTPGYRPHLRDYVLQAVSEWSAASGGRVKMEVWNGDPAKADIIVSWVQQLPGALGVMRPIATADGEITRARIEIACNADSQGRALPAESTATRAVFESRDRMVREVALHEMGHAIGLDHSARNDDIMANGVFGLNSADVMSARSLQPGDIERITQLYSAPRSMPVSKIIALISGSAGSAKTVKASQPVTSGAGAADVRAQVATSQAARAMKQAIFNMNAGRYEDCIAMLKELLLEEPSNAQAHYLMAVAFVNTRNFPDAAKQYKEVLRLAPQGKLAELAHAGLTKIGVK